MINVESNSNLLGQRGKLTGKVVNNVRFHEGTLTVRVSRSIRHPKYKKSIIMHKKYIVQFDPKTEIALGTEVVIAQRSPVSKLKRWTVVSISEEKGNL